MGTVDTYRDSSHSKQALRVPAARGLHLPLGALRRRCEEQKVGMMMPYDYHMYKVSPEMYAHFESLNSMG